MSDYTVEKDWITKSGLRAAVVMTGFGHRCGYVAVPEQSPLFGVRYSQTTPALKANMDRTLEKMSPLQVLGASFAGEDNLNTPEYVFEVHGGITFSGDGDGEYPVHSNLWWFGYDCAHCDDAPAPGSTMYQFDNLMGKGDRIHRTLQFCIDECESLAQQIVEKTILPEAAIGQG